MPIIFYYSKTIKEFLDNIKYFQISHFTPFLNSNKILLFSNTKLIYEAYKTLITDIQDEVARNDGDILKGYKLL